MARKPLNERHVRKITKVGGKSYAVTLPIHIIRQLGWRERQKVVVLFDGKEVRVRDWKKSDR